MPVLQDGELVLYGTVGIDDIFEGGFTAREVLTALAEVGRDNDVVVRLNSGGGIIDDGLAIYNALSAHRGNVRVEIDGVAASAASILAMGGDEVVMKAGSVMMVHDPAVLTIGTLRDHENSMEGLTAFASQMASIYSERTGRSIEDVRAEMEDELWMTAEEAVVAGYADEATSGKAKVAAAFDFSVYANAPKRLKTLAKRKNWSFETTKQAVEDEGEDTLTQERPVAEHPRQQQEKSMADTETAGDESATDTKQADKPDLEAIRAEAAAQAVEGYRARRQTIMASAEAEGREALAEHLVDTDMSIEQVTATLSVAPRATAKVADPADDKDEKESGQLNGTGLGVTAGKTPAKSLADRMRAKYQKGVA